MVFSVFFITFAEELCFKDESSLSSITIRLCNDRHSFSCNVLETVSVVRHSGQRCTDRLQLIQILRTLLTRRTEDRKETVGDYSESDKCAAVLTLTPPYSPPKHFFPFPLSSHVYNIRMYQETITKNSVIMCSCIYLHTHNDFIS